MHASYVYLGWYTLRSKQNLFTRGIWHRTENLLYKLDLDPMDRLNNSAICPEWFNGLVQLP